jgi:hypothetical protein
MLLRGASALATVERILARLEQVRSQRSAVLEIWRQCYDVTYPARGAGLQMPDAAMPWGAGMAESYALTKQPDVYDSTAPDACRILASGIVSGVTPGNMRWFNLEVGHDSESEKRWLEKAAEALWEEIHNSNFESVGWECALDLTISGQFILYAPESPSGFEFQQWPLAKCFPVASRIGGPIDTVYYEDEFPLEQVVNEYGEAALSPESRAAWARCLAPNSTEKRDQPVKVVLAVYPRDMTEHRGREARFGYEMPWACCHIEVKAKHLLREEGFMEMPLIWPRWHRLPASIFAVGPMYEALPDTKTLNEITRLDLMNLDVAITGMWGAVDDGVLNPQAIKLGPRKVIVMRDKDSFFSLQSGADVKAALLEIERLQRAIRRILMADQLEPQDKPGMTAYEVHVRVELIRQLLGPVYGRLQAEYLQPFVRRCFGIGYRHGLFGRAPRSLADRLLQVKYISPLARAQKLVEVQAMDRYETTLGQEARIFGPAVLDNYLVDEAVRRRAELLGVPADLLPDKDRMAAVRERRARMMAQQAQQAAAAEGAPEGGQGAVGTESAGVLDAVNALRADLGAAAGVET